MLRIKDHIDDFDEERIKKSFAEDSGKKICLAINSESDYRIIVSDQASDYVYESANELSRYLNRIINSTNMFEVIKESELQTDKFISIGHTDISLSLDTSKILDDGFLIKVDFNGIYILTNDDRFILNGIYGFLEDKLECMFVRDDFDYIPNLPTICFEPFEYVSNPDFAWRKVFQYEVSQNGWYKKLKNNGATDGDIEINKLWGTWCHDVFTFVSPDKYQKQHPEYFAYDSKKKPAQLCLTNEDIYPIIERKMSELIAQNPDKIYWDFSINDNTDYCKCKRCEAVLKQTGSMMGTMLPVINRLARQFPDKIISTLAYTYNEKAPIGMKCEPNVNIVLAPISSGQFYSYSSHQSQKALKTKALIEDWSKISSRLMIWDYVVDFKHLLMPYPNFDVQKDNHALYLANNVKAVFHQGSREKNDEMARLRTYILSRQLWDNNIDISKVLAKYIRVTYREASVYVAEYLDLMNREIKDKGKDLDLYDEVPDHKKDYLSRENIDNYLELINNAIASVTEERIVGYLEEIKINILYSIMNEKDLNYGRKKAAFDEFCSLVEKLDIEKPSEFGISMDEYIRKVFPRRLKRCSFFSHLCNERGTFMHFKRTNIAPLKSATGKKNKMPFSDIALNLEYKGVSVTDDSHWYWCVSPIYDENNSVHLFCSRWRTSEKGMALWSSESEIVHFVGNSPEGPFNYVETVLSNDNIPFPEWQAAPHNPQIYKFEEQYALVYIVQDKRVKNGGMKTGLMLSDSLNGPWHFAGNDGIVVKESTDKTHWTYHSKTGTENPAMAKIDDTYYIFFKAGKAQNRKMHYGYATSKSIEGPYIMCNEPKMDNIHYVEDATAFQQNGKTYLLTTDNFGKNTGIFGAGILWKMRDGYFKRENAEIGFGVLSDYTDLPGTATFCDNDRSTKLERPGILMKNGKPEYFYGCTRTDVFGSGKSQCYVFKINFKEK